MRHEAAASLAAIYREACALDVQAFKPGNVSLASAGHDMRAEDFLRSARFSAAAITYPDIPLGQRVFDAVAATRRHVGCNTNLGIVLLAAPLLQARLDHPDMALRDGLRRVLAGATRNDTEAVNRAICLAAPGGLGELPEHDVSQVARLPLALAMHQAADRDMIARQYANDFADLFDDIQPCFRRWLTGGAHPETAVTETFLHLLTRHPDSHIQRKHGARTALQVRDMARETRRCHGRASRADTTSRCLARLDFTLKARRLNPGTSADLCVAAVITDRLLMQATSNAGEHPDNPRTARAVPARVPLSTTSRRYEGESKWQQLPKRWWVKPWWVTATRLPISI